MVSHGLGPAVPQGAGVGPRRIIRPQGADDGQAAFLVHTLPLLELGVGVRQPGATLVPVHLSVAKDPLEAATGTLGSLVWIHTLDALWEPRRGRCFWICFGTYKSQCQTLRVKCRNNMPATF